MTTPSRPLQEGVVPRNREHFVLWFVRKPWAEHKPEPIAFVGRDQGGFVVEYQPAPDDDEAGAAWSEARDQIEFYLIRKRGYVGWDYAIYHTRTGANLYSAYGAGHSGVYWTYVKCE